MFWTKCWSQAYLNRDGSVSISRLLAVYFPEYILKLTMIPKQQSIAKTVRWSQDHDLDNIYQDPVIFFIACNGLLLRPKIV